MKKFDKISPEYLSNGHYRFDDQEWMSVWAYKIKFGEMTPNTNKVNGAEGKQLVADGISYHLSKPDFGSFPDIFIYPVEVLHSFYEQ